MIQIQMGFVKRNAKVIPDFFELSEVNLSVLIFVILVAVWNSDHTSLSILKKRSTGTRMRSSSYNNLHGGMRDCT